MDTLLPSHPETYRQLIKRSLIFYRVSFLHVIGLSLLLAFIVFIPRLLQDILGKDIFLYTNPLSLKRLWLVAINLTGLLIFIAIIWRMHCIIRRVHEPLVQDFKMGLKKVLYVFIAALIQSLVLFAIALIIFGCEILLQEYRLIFNQHPIGIVFTFFIFIGQFFLILYVFSLFLFLVPLIAIENRGILLSLETSILLVWNHWWRVFSLQITPWIFYLIALLLIRNMLDIDLHIYFTEGIPHTIWATILNLVLFALFIPWVAATLLVQLKDLELRRNLSLSKNAKRRRK